MKQISINNENIVDNIIIENFVIDVKNNSYSINIININEEEINVNEIVLVFYDEKGDILKYQPLVEYNMDKIIKPNDSIHFLIKENKFDVTKIKNVSLHREK